MSNNQKTLLKEAKDAIKNKKFDSALKLSKTILKSDKNNYMGLIFLGISLQEVGPIDQASKAFKKAIQLDANNPLGWTGLINYYEKSKDSNSEEELVKAYVANLKIETNENKLSEYSEKLTALITDSCNEEAVKVVYGAYEKCDGSSKANSILNTLVNYLKNFKEISDDCKSIYATAIAKLLNDRNFQTSELYSVLLTFLHKQNKIDELLEHAEIMFEKFNSNSMPLLWLCKVYNECYVEENDTYRKLDDKIAFYCSELLKMDPKNAMGLFTQSILSYKEGKIMNAKENMFNVTSTRAGLMHAWAFLAQIYSKLNFYDEALNCVLKADRLLKSINYSNAPLTRLVTVLKVEMFAKSESEELLNNAVEIYNNLEDENVRTMCSKYIIDAYIALEKFDEADLLLKPLETTQSIVYKLNTARILRKKGEYQEALGILQSENVDKANWWFEIGLNQWQLEKQQSLSSFIKAAKCDPFNYNIFLQLGRYYSDFNDLEKARRCFEKATRICPKSETAAVELCTVYRKLQNWDDNAKFLENLTNNSISKVNYWAWLQLGLTYLEQGNYVSAIDNLRLVIRVDSRNVHCWEALADAYYARGAYTSAIKCYKIVLELAPNALYASLQIGNIEKMLGEFTEARNKFEDILKGDHSYLPALKGLSETCMLQARQCLKEQRLGTAKDHAQYAADKISLGVQSNSDFSCLWKILADCCLFVARLPDKYSFLTLPKSLVEGKHAEGIVQLDKDNVFSFSVRSYCKAISLIDDNVLLWHDLSGCYFQYAVYSKNRDLDKAEELFNYALAAAQHCTKTNPTNIQHWNLLGNIAMLKVQPNYALAQHAFIQAVTVDNNSATAWCNLGVLYLLLDEIKLANKAFGHGQRSDPDYVHSWIGQALIAERLGSDDAMDLYRHTTQLGPHQQGALGYGQYVCQTLLDAPKKADISIHAIPVACDALTWYTEKNPTNSCAWNMLGILQERLGLKRNALHSFKNAFELSEKNVRDRSRVNYARLMMKLGDYSGAIAMFREVEEATFNSGSGLALALFKDQQYEASYNAYEQSLNWLTENETKQSDLLVGLASIAYMFQGPEVAKTLLFQSIQLKPSSPFGLFATLALILLHDDVKLAQLVLKEMDVIKDDMENLRHYALLLSYVCLCKGEQQKAVIEVSKLTHRHPDNPFLWLILSTLLIRLRRPSMAAANCALLAMELGKASMDVTKVMCLVSLGSHIAGNEKEAQIAAQKAVHCYPNEAEGWAVLAYVLRMQKKAEKLVEQLLKQIEGMKVSGPLLEWTKTLTVN